MGRTITAAVVSSVMAALVSALLLKLITGEVNVAVVAGIAGAVGATSAMSAAARKPKEREPFDGVFDAETPAEEGR